MNGQRGLQFLPRIAMRSKISDNPQRRERRASNSRVAEVQQVRRAESAELTA